MISYFEFIGSIMFWIVMYLEYKRSTILQRKERRPRTIVFLIIGLIVMSVLGYYFLSLKQDPATFSNIVLALKFSSYLICFVYLLRFMFLKFTFKP